MNKSESAEHRSIFTEAQSDIRKRLWRCVAGETRRRLCRVSNETRAPSE